MLKIVSQILREINLDSWGLTNCEDCHFHRIVILIHFYILTISKTLNS